jgi:hypothetical protein
VVSGKQRGEYKGFAYVDEGGEEKKQKKSTDPKNQDDVF